jgi:hypothetical protein
MSHVFALTAAENVWFLSQPPKQQKKSLCMFGIQVGKTHQASCCAAANNPHKQYPKASAALHNTQQLAARTPKAQKTVARFAFRQYTVKKGMLTKIAKGLKNGRLKNSDICNGYRRGALLFLVQMQTLCC